MKLGPGGRGCTSLRGKRADCLLDPSVLASENPDLLPILERVLKSLGELRLGQAICWFTVHTVTFDIGISVALPTYIIDSNRLEQGFRVGQAEYFGGGGTLPTMGPGQLWVPLGILGFPLIPSIRHEKVPKGK